MGFVYLIQQGYDSCFKIGSSADNVNGRLVNLQVGNPKKLRIFGTIEIEEYEKLEDTLQSRFDPYKENGEWYAIDSITAVAIINECNGKVCVNDPYRFSVSNGKTEIDIAKMTEVMEDRILISVNDLIKKQLSAFIDEIKVTSEMAKAVAHRKASRRKSMTYFLIIFFSTMISCSGGAFFFCFGIDSNGWTFTQNRMITFCLIAAGAFVLSLTFGALAWNENKGVTDVEINWHQFNAIRKKYLKEGM